MKPTPFLRHFLLLAGSSLLAVSSSNAANTWDGGGGDGNWNTFANWDDNSTPGAGLLTFAGNSQTTTNNNLAGTDLPFAGINFTNDGSGGNTNAFTLSGNRITLGGNITTTANTAGSTITDEISMALLLDATRTITTNQLSASVQHNLLISGDISATGAFGITKAGLGTLTLSGANNSYTGAVAINAGVLNIRDDTALGTIAGGVTVASGAALEMQGGIAVGNESLGLSGTGISSGGALRNISGNNSYAGLITLNASGVRINSDSGLLTLDVASGNAITGSNRAVIFGGAGDITVADSMSLGSVSNALTKDGAGNLTLGANNSYVGMTVISGGSITVSSVKSSGTAQPLGTGGTPFTNFGINFSNGGKLIYNGSGDTTNMGFILSGNGVIEANNATGTLTIANGTNGINRPSGNYSMTLSGTGNGEWSGGIARANASGSTTIIKEGTGTWTLSGSNTVNNGPAGGFDVNQGTLLATQQTALSPLYNTSGHVTVANGAILALRAGAASGWTATEIGNLLGAATFASGSNLGIDVNNLDSFTYSASLGAGQTAKNLVKSGLGTLTLNTVSQTYTGTTKITGGTLALSGAGSIANSPLIQISSSTTLDVTAVTGNFNIASTQTVGGNGTILATGKTVEASGTLSPGNSPGTLIQDGGTLQLDGVNGDLNWQVLDASGPAGTGYDTVSLTNGATLDLSQLSALNPYDINLWSLSSIGPDVNGNANFNSALSYSWTLFSTGSVITGFDPTFFDISVLATNGTSGFSNALGGGSFSVGLGDGGTDLMLHFTAIPEPNVAALIGGFGVIALLRRRRA